MSTANWLSTTHATSEIDLKNPFDFSELKKARERFGYAQKYKNPEMSETNKFLLKQMEEPEKFETGHSFQKDDHVMLIGLKSEKFNGATGVIQEFIESTRRYKVKLNKIISGKEEVSIDAKKLILRFYSVSITVPLSQSKKIHSLDRLYKAWREFSFWQVDQWLTLGARGSQKRDTFEYHATRCLGYRRFDPRRMDDVDLQDYFKDHKNLFDCDGKRCNFLRILTKWRLVEAIARNWNFVTSILFELRIEEIPQKWQERWLSSLQKICRDVWTLIGIREGRKLCYVEIPKSGKLADAKLPGLRILHDQAIPIIEACLRVEEETPFAKWEFHPRWKPRPRDVGIDDPDDRRDRERDYLSGEKYD